MPNIKDYYKRGDIVYRIDPFSHKAYPTLGSCYNHGLGKGWDVYLYKGAFVSKEQLYLTMGHEYLHAGFNMLSTSIANRYITHYQHAAIYDWSKAQAEAWHYNESYYRALYNNYSSYMANNPFSYQSLGFYILPINPFL